MLEHINTQRIPIVIVKVADHRPRCWHCGRLFDQAAIQFKPHYHNQCIVKKYGLEISPIITEEEEQATPLDHKDYFAYLDSILAPTNL